MNKSKTKLYAKDSFGCQNNFPAQGNDSYKIKIRDIY